MARAVPGVVLRSEGGGAAPQLPCGNRLLCAVGAPLHRLSLPMPADDLAAFSADLRGCLERGELADLPPIDLGNEVTLSHVERAVRRMLQDVELFRAMD